jgi:hypothetical protein
LIRLGLILYRRPIYQLLGLEEAAMCRERQPRRPAAASAPPPSPAAFAPALQTPAFRPFPLRAAVEALLRKGGAA